MTTTLRPRRRDFPGWHMVWTLSATCTVAYGVLFYAFAVFVVPMREDLGASTGQLSGALSLAIAVNGAGAGAIGVLSVAGRVALTGLARRAELAQLTAVMVAGQAVGVAALLTLPRTAGVAVFVVLFGAGFGVMTIARPWLLGRYVPVRVFGSVSGRQSLATGLGRVVAPVAAGALITAAGYAPALLAVAACALGAAALLLAAERAHA